MGMFDTVWAFCPRCGVKTDLQSKGGPCDLNNYQSSYVPKDVAEGLLIECSSEDLEDSRSYGHPFWCEKCGIGFIVELVPLCGQTDFVSIKLIQVYVPHWEVGDRIHVPRMVHSFVFTDTVTPDTFGIFVGYALSCMRINVDRTGRRKRIKELCYLSISERKRIEKL